MNSNLIFSLLLLLLVASFSFSSVIQPETNDLGTRTKGCEVYHRGKETRRGVCVGERDTHCLESSEKEIVFDDVRYDDACRESIPRDEIGCCVHFYDCKVEDTEGTYSSFSSRSPTHFSHRVNISSDVVSIHQTTKTQLLSLDFVRTEQSVKVDLRKVREAMDVDICIQTQFVALSARFRSSINARFLRCCCGYNFRFRTTQNTYCNIFLSRMRMRFFFTHIIYTHIHNTQKRRRRRRRNIYTSNIHNNTTTQQHNT